MLYVKVVAVDAHELIAKVMANILSDIFVVLFPLKYVSRSPCTNIGLIKKKKKKFKDKDFQSKTVINMRKQNEVS